MKKSIIAASAASLALAAMPVVTTFANTGPQEIVDNIEITLNSTCTMTRDGASSSADGGGAWVSGSSKYTKTMDAGTTSELGTSTFHITCNDTTNGHYLTLSTSGLVVNDNSNTLAVAAPINYAATAVGTSSSSWNIHIVRPETVGDTTPATQNTLPTINTSALTNDGYAVMTNGSVDLYGSSANKDTTVLNDAQFTATYNVGTKVTQPIGTYTGTATYTLTHGPASTGN